MCKRRFPIQRLAKNSTTAAIAADPAAAIANNAAPSMNFQNIVRMTTTDRCGSAGSKWTVTDVPGGNSAIRRSASGRL